MLITSKYNDEYKNLKTSLQVCTPCLFVNWFLICSNAQNALGCISLTSDLWSDPNLRSFMAVTAHWMAKGKTNQLELRSALIAFREVVGSHSGENLSHVLFDIIQNAGIADKVH